MSEQSRKDAQDFLKVAAQFKLGDLPTEQQHPLTKNLAELSRTNLPQAISILKDIDTDVLDEAIRTADSIEPLRTAMRDTFNQQGRVFFYGCGATGRLSMSIEYLWRFLYPKSNAVTGFMSGGDLALVHSIENFEDRPDWGARQVREIGFNKNDLLVSTTEGGETPSVIGATEEAARISARKPFFMYCNPDNVLRNVERSRNVLENPAIEKIPLSVGPMALSGSTRLQSSTILMLQAATALFGLDTKKLAEFRDFWAKLDLSFLPAFTEKEAEIYQQGGRVLYETRKDDYGITLLTDTTERAPTFSLTGFENKNEPNAIPSWSYFRFLDSPNAEDALTALVRRPVKALEWDELNGVGSKKRFLGFDFSNAVMHNRTPFRITSDADTMVFSLGNLHHKIDVSTLHPLHEHLLLKMIMNAHSTLVMGRMNRFESNVMTWVKPSNNKLIDRAIRYSDALLKQDGIEASYEEICNRLFEEREKLKPGEPIVLKVVDSFKPKP